MSFLVFLSLAVLAGAGEGPVPPDPIPEDRDTFFADSLGARAKERTFAIDFHVVDFNLRTVPVAAIVFDASPGTPNRVTALFAFPIGLAADLLNIDFHARQLRTTILSVAAFLPAFDYASVLGGTGAGGPQPLVVLTLGPNVRFGRVFGAGVAVAIVFGRQSETTTGFVATLNATWLD